MRELAISKIKIPYYPPGTRDQFFFLFQGNFLKTFAVSLLCGALFDERMGL
jgi:hypothetical protein